MSCKLPLFEPIDEITDEKTETYIEENSSLFDEIDNRIIFQTNNTRYLQQNGTTLWCVKKKNESVGFEEIEVTVSKLSGRQETGYGIVFLQQEYEGKDFLLTVMINTKGEYIFGKVIDGKFTCIKNWQTSPYLNMGYGIKNKIGVTLEKGSFCIKLNNTKVADFSITENIQLKDSKSGFVVVVSGNERFPENSVNVVFMDEKGEK